MLRITALLLFVWALDLCFTCCGGQAAGRGLHDRFYIKPPFRARAGTVDLTCVDHHCSGTAPAWPLTSP